MNIAEYSVVNKVVTWLFVLILVGGGVGAYEEMGKLEDPAFTIKEAKVITLYPGATVTQVESEVTYHVEDAVQQLGQLKRIKMSISRPGYSEVTVEFKDEYGPKDMPSIYDELRRKIADMKHKLPPGAQAPSVVDDFADVFGIFLTVSGDGYSYRDLKDVADRLKKQLVLIDGVRKVSVQGVQQEVVYFEISRARLAELGIPVHAIGEVLRSVNQASPAGSLNVGNDYIRIHPTGEAQSVNEIGDVFVTSEDKTLIRLSDIGEIVRAYKDPATSLYYSDGKPAVALAISMSAGENVIAVGDRIEQRLAEMASVIPVGIEIKDTYNQPKEVDSSVSGFINSVIEALIIVVAVLLVFMGARVGLIIGAVLLITVAGTLWIMNMFGIELQRISLGALIIALGMLVDNAIVVAEGMLIRIQQGMSGRKAAGETVGQTFTALLGGTIIGILAFSGIGFSTDNTGEFARSLFYVILISLSLSWFTAITTTPLLCALFIKKTEPKEGEEEKDPYDSGMFRGYKALLLPALKFKYVTVAVAAGFFAMAVYGFGHIKEGFFPDANTPIFFVDVWQVEGTDISTTKEDTLRLEAWIREQEEVVQTTTIVGSGAVRFTLVYSPESSTATYAQIIVKVEDREQIAGLQDRIDTWLMENLPNTEPKIKNLRIGPGRDSKIEARFSGPDPDVLRQLSEQAQAIMHADDDAREVRDDWRQPVKVIVPQFNEQVGRQLGINRSDFADALQFASEGAPGGIFRDGNRLLPIYLRAPEEERASPSDLTDIQVYSPVLERFIPIGQVSTGFETKMENNIIRNRNRLHTIIASCNPISEFATPLFNRVRPQIEAIELPPGYILEWGGEYEDATDAQNSLFDVLPGGFLLMIIVSIMLFGRIRQPLIIWLVVPMAIVGITFGLLLMDGAFDFMALLGALSLVGLQIKNAIVLIEEIDLQKSTGKNTYDAIVDASISRLRPVLMAASTTILGVIPLLSDVFFAYMSITIMFGLGFATALTMLVVPALYLIFFDDTKELAQEKQLAEAT
ncbi:efflux RND transporter permease subunit [Paraferrimonas sedimenticola]|uniref:Multidrug transporter AcrB n=1 Tax=Paraferrimonas sedimenticola TaxID=375674 RepID=A0AA37RSL8_9GAMM|nr:efflux RND transporter permease subunit [Paraferrimonas sedimenticola]GLP95205.1 multidrug transporter AcrB [Paraferrimonas sedimenticola]